jgi:hypothetical protein
MTTTAFRAALNLFRKSLRRAKALSGQKQRHHKGHLWQVQESIQQNSPLELAWSRWQVIFDKLISTNLECLHDKANPITQRNRHEFKP